MFREKVNLPPTEKPVRPKALVIHGHMKSLSDLLRLAKHNGRMALHVKKVTVLPYLIRLEKEKYVVLVEPKV